MRAYFSLFLACLSLLGAASLAHAMGQAHAHTIDTLQNAFNPWMGVLTVALSMWALRRRIL